MGEEGRGPERWQHGEDRDLHLPTRSRLVASLLLHMFHHRTFETRKVEKVALRTARSPALPIGSGQQRPWLLRLLLTLLSVGGSEKETPGNGVAPVNTFVHS